MGKFKYTARSSDNKEGSGTIDAQTTEEAMNLLHSFGCREINLVEEIDDLEVEYTPPRGKRVFNKKVRWDGGYAKSSTSIKGDDGNTTNINVEIREVVDSDEKVKEKKSSGCGNCLFWIIVLIILSMIL